LAFAYKTDPERIMEFGQKLNDGVMLEENSPAWTLAKYLQGEVLGSGVSRYVMARKVLNAALAHLEDRKLTKIVDGSSGLDRFLAAYNGRSVVKMTEPWAVETESHSHQLFQ
jgi:hypothetical protein